MVAVITLAGCAGVGTPTPSADIQLTSIGQDTVDNGNAARVTGAVKNYGDASDSVVAVIKLLNGEQTIAERRVDLGILKPGESATFQVTISVDADAVDGRRITFK